MSGLKGPPSPSDQAPEESHSDDDSVYSAADSTEVKIRVDGKIPADKNPNEGAGLAGDLGEPQNPNPKGPVSTDDDDDDDKVAAKNKKKALAAKAAQKKRDSFAFAKEVTGEFQSIGGQMMKAFLNGLPYLTPLTSGLGIRPLCAIMGSLRDVVGGGTLMVGSAGAGLASGTLYALLKSPFKLANSQTPRLDNTLGKLTGILLDTSKKSGVQFFMGTIALPYISVAVAYGAVQLPVAGFTSERLHAAEMPLTPTFLDRFIPKIFADVGFQFKNCMASKMEEGYIEASKNYDITSAYRAAIRTGDGVGNSLRLEKRVQSAKNTAWTNASLAKGRAEFNAQKLTSQMQRLDDMLLGEHESKKYPFLNMSRLYRSTIGSQSEKIAANLSSLETRIDALDKLDPGAGDRLIDQDVLQRLKDQVAFGRAAAGTEELMTRDPLTNANADDDGFGFRVISRTNNLALNSSADPNRAIYRNFVAGQRKIWQDNNVLALITNMLEPVAADKPSDADKKIIDALSNQQLASKIDALTHKLFKASNDSSDSLEAIKKVLREHVYELNTRIAKAAATTSDATKNPSLLQLMISRSPRAIFNRALGGSAREVNDILLISDVAEGVLNNRENVMGALSAYHAVVNRSTDETNEINTQKELEKEFMRSGGLIPGLGQAARKRQIEARYNNLIDMLAKLDPNELQDIMNSARNGTDQKTLIRREFDRFAKLCKDGVIGKDIPNSASKYKALYEDLSKLFNPDNDPATLGDDLKNIKVKVEGFQQSLQTTIEIPRIPPLGLFDRFLQAVNAKPATIAQNYMANNGIASLADLRREMHSVNNQIQDLRQERFLFATDSLTKLTKFQENELSRLETRLEVLRNALLISMGQNSSQSGVFSVAQASSFARNRSGVHQAMQDAILLAEVNLTLGHDQILEPVQNPPLVNAAANNAKSSLTGLLAGLASMMTAFTQLFGRKGANNRVRASSSTDTPPTPPTHAPVVQQPETSNFREHAPSVATPPQSQPQNVPPNAGATMSRDRSVRPSIRKRFIDYLIGRNANNRQLSLRIGGGRGRGRGRGRGVTSVSVAAVIQAPRLSQIAPGSLNPDAATNETPTGSGNPVFQQEKNKNLLADATNAALQRTSSTNSMGSMGD